MNIIRENKVLYFIFSKIKYYKFDILLLLPILYYIYRYRVLTTTLTTEFDTMPGFSWQNRDLLAGHKILSDPFFMGGAFTTSINSYNFGPIPHTYPSFLGWILNNLFSNYNITQFYFTLNILYFMTLFIIILPLIFIFKYFGKIGAYVYIFIMLSSISINSGNRYFTSLPTHLNPGSLQFYSIALLFLFLLSMIDNKKIYHYLLIFFSGIFLQNYIASGFLAFIILIYAIIFLFKNYKLFNKDYLFITLSFIPWIQIFLYKILDYKEIFYIINWIGFRNTWYNETNSVDSSTLYNQMPFNSLVFNFFDISKYSERLSLVFFFMFLFFIISNYIFIRKEILKFGFINKMIYLNIITIFFIIDYFIINIIAKEPQQYNHIAGHSYLFFFLVLYKIITNINFNKKVFSLFILIIIAVTSSSSSADVYYQDKRILSDSVSSLLLSTPVKLVKYDFYNVSEVAYTDLVYELLEKKADLCLVKPDLSNYLNDANRLDNLTSSLHLVEHLYCSKEQLLDESRLSIYLVEDASLSLPLYFSGMTKISVLINDATRRCVPELHRNLLDSSSDISGNCLPSYIFNPHYNLSLYIDRTYNKNSIYKHQNNYIESLILSGKDVWGNG